MDDKTFARIVAEEVKNKASDNQRAFLRLPENRSRWITALDDLATNLRRQIDSIEAACVAELEAARTEPDATSRLVAIEAEHEDRRRRIDRFAFFVSQRRAEVSADASVGDAKGPIDEIARLRAAIVAHQRAIIALGERPTLADVALWTAA